MSERSAQCEKKGKTDKVKNKVEELKIKKKNTELLKACFAIAEAPHCSPSNPPLTFYFHYAHEDPGAVSLCIATDLYFFLYLCSVLSLLLHCILLWGGTVIQ